MSHHVSSLITSPKGESITISVIGAGGTGSILLGTLARLNQALLRLRRIYLRVRVFDPDRISDNNVTRQSYSPSDLGKFKSKTIVERLNRFYNTQWIGFPYRWEEAPEIVRANIIITCIDTAASRIRLSKKLKHWADTTDHPKKFAYWIDVGNTATTFNVVMGGHGREQGEISPDEWVAGTGAERIKRDANPEFITDMYDLRKHERKNPGPSCSLAESLERQHIMVNDFAAKTACFLLWDLFTLEEISWRGAWGNIDNLNIKKIKC